MKRIAVVIAAATLVMALTMAQAGCGRKDTPAYTGKNSANTVDMSDVAVRDNTEERGNIKETGNTGESGAAKAERDTEQDDGKKESDTAIKPSLAGISLGDSKEKVEEILGKDYKETYYEVAGHFAETYYGWKYENGISVYIGKDSSQVLEVRATCPGTETNLGIKVGDNADTVFNAYRSKYIEPESLHGGKLIGWFKVESGAVMAFNFNIEDGITNPGEVNGDTRVEEIILTYPAHVDDSF